MKKTFNKQHLLGLGLPHKCTGGNVVSRKICGKERWSVVYELVFRLLEMPQDEAWMTHYSVGATEMQSESPWEDAADVECTLVRKVERVVKVWEPAEDKP